MKLLLTFALLCSGLCAQAPIAAATPFVSDGEVYAVLHYTDGSMAVAAKSGETTELATKDGTFESRFVDKDGTTHIVSTPKPKSDGGQKAAIQRHVAAYRLMRAAFP